MPNDRGRRPDTDYDPDYNRTPEPEPGDAQSHERPGVRAAHPSTKRNVSAIGVIATVVVSLVIAAVVLYYIFAGGPS